jgi:multiple sugar transport system substrate-binding protein
MSAVAVAAGVALAGPAFAQQQKLTVWWAKGFYKAEDDALFAAIKKFEQRNPNIKIDLSLYAPQEAIPKVVAALDANNPPDVAYGDVFDFQVTAKWAYEGKLEDITSVIDPLRNKFEPRALSTTFLYNNANQSRAYYAYPVKQQTMHIQYWKDMLTDAGFKESDIPKTWKEYWSFWCDKVQPAYRQKSGNRAFGTGFPMGVDSSDAFYSFLTFMDAYNVKLVSDSGKVLVDDPAVRQGLINAVNDYTWVYGKGCTPPSSTNWKDPDNNVAFHNKTIVLTHNATISIAAKWLDDMNNQTLTAEQRAQAKKNYEELIATAQWPNKPDGRPMSYLAAIKVAVAFSGTKNEKRAKEFIAFMMEDANLIPYTEGSLGRWYPVTQGGADRTFWTGEDKHRKAVSDQFRAGTGTFPFTRNWRFTILNNENVWAKAMSRIVNDKWTPERAADELIERVNQVAGKQS